MNNAPKTALELADMVEKMAPIELKTRLYDLLMWQHRHGKRPGHIRQYLEATYYSEHPRPKPLPPDVQRMMPTMRSV